ncbi:MAG: YhcN/YlaJ family sporulation lipoprotein [Bacillus sp. (in: firmicutes)]
MKKSWMILGSAVLSLSLTGCGGDDNAGGVNNNDNNNGASVQSNEVRPIANNRNNNRTLRISDRAEKQVERLDQVDDAHVIISNNNAYVTVRLANKQNNNNNANNGNNRNARTSMDNGDNGNARPIIDNGNNRNAKTIIDNGTVNQDGNDGMINGRGDAGNGNRDNKTSDPGIGNGGNLGVDDNNNNNIFGIGNGDNNNNGNNNNNTIGTKEEDQYSKVSNRFEQNIADQVRKADSKIHKVYVSVDPNLYNRMNTYANDIRTNGNRDGLFEDFNTTVNDFFGRNND